MSNTQVMNLTDLYQRLGIHAIRRAEVDGEPKMIIELDTGAVIPIMDAFTVKLWRFILAITGNTPAPFPNTRDWPESESGH